MKKLLSVLLAALLLIGCIMTLASCGGLSGKYEADLVVADVSYTFKGSNKVVVVIEPIIGDDVVLDGTYELTEDEAGNKAITITFTDNSSEEAKQYGGTLAFSEGVEDGDRYVKIGGIKYTKK